MAQIATTAGSSRQAGVLKQLSALVLMMAVTGVSLPETIILRRVLKPALLVMFVGTVAVAIILTGYLFNWIL
jgi:uncharacterized membrane protein YraQ (UPF0718 family)